MYGIPSHMKPDIVGVINRAWPELTSMGIEHLDLFGSVARGSAGPESDVDIMVHLRSPSLHALVEIRDFLQSLLGRKVDVLTPGALASRPRLQERLLKEAIRVA